MIIRKANISDADIVKHITHTTILKIYPHYYPEGAVNFFLSHHNDKNIIKDINKGEVYLLSDKNTADVGTVTINGNEINRLFVLPDYQGNGYGRELMLFAESIIKQNYEIAELSASLSAKRIYMKNGYVQESYHIIECPNGDKLCYDYMTKKL